MRSGSLPVGFLLQVNVFQLTSPPQSQSASSIMPNSKVPILERFRSRRGAVCGACTLCIIVIFHIKRTEIFVHTTFISPMFLAYVPVCSVLLNLVLNQIFVVPPHCFAHYIVCDSWLNGLVPISPLDILPSTSDHTPTISITWSSEDNPLGFLLFPVVGSGARKGVGNRVQ